MCMLEIVTVYFMRADLAQIVEQQNVRSVLWGLFQQIQLKIVHKIS